MTFLFLRAEKQLLAAMMRKFAVILVLLSVVVAGCSPPATPADEARQRGESWKSRGNYEKAIEEFTEAIRLNPNDEEAYWGRYQAWRALGEFGHQLDDNLNEVIRLNPNHVPARYARGFLRTTGDPAGAIEDFTVVVELPVTSDTAYLQQASYYERGRTLNELGRYDEAIEDFDAVIRLDPSHANAYSNRGDSWMAKREYDKAIADYDECIRLDSSKSHTGYKRERALQAKGGQ